MRTSKGLTVFGVVRAAAVAVGLSIPVAAGVLLAATPANAQTILEPAQISAIRSLLTTKLQGVKENDAVVSVFSQSTQTSVQLYGSRSAYSVATAVMAIGEGLDYSPCLIGAALGNAASALMPRDSSAATAIAQAVANEGVACARIRFREAATGSGFADLALIADQDPTVTGATGGVPDNGGPDTPITGGFDGGGPGCLNPSCTKP